MGDHIHRNTHMSEGVISPDESNAVMAALTAQLRIVESAELEKRIVALEALQAKGAKR